MSKEIWKDIPDYEGIYQASTFGRIKSLKSCMEKILKQSICGGGYSLVRLYKDKAGKTKRVHQLIAITFLNHKPCGLQLVVDHIDFNKENNRLDNLRIITHRENTNKKHLKSSSKYTGVSWSKRYKKWNSAIHINRKYKHLGYFDIEEDAAMAYSLKLQEINRTKQISYEQQN